MLIGCSKTAQIAIIYMLHYFPSTRHRLLTVLSHGWQSEELTQQINTLAERHKDSVLLLETECEEVSSSQYPWKRCSSALAKVYKYPDILRVIRSTLLNSILSDPCFCRSQGIAFCCLEFAKEILILWIC